MNQRKQKSQNCERFWHLECISLVFSTKIRSAGTPKSHEFKTFPLWTHECHIVAINLSFLGAMAFFSVFLCCWLRVFTPSSTTLSIKLLLLYSSNPSGSWFAKIRWSRPWAATRFPHDPKSRERRSHAVSPFQHPQVQAFLRGWRLEGWWGLVFLAHRWYVKIYSTLPKPHPLSPAESTTSAYHLEVPTMLPQRLLRTTTLLSSLRFHQIGLWISLSLSIAISISSPIFMFVSVPDWPEIERSFPLFGIPAFITLREICTKPLLGAGTWQSWCFK